MITVRRAIYWHCVYSGRLAFYLIKAKFGKKADCIGIFKYTHTHTHSFNGPFSRTTRVGRYQKGKTNLDFTKSRDSEWQWHQLAYSSLHLAPDRQPRQHLTTQFFTGRMPFLPPNQQHQSTEGNNFANTHVSKMIDPVCDIYITDLLAHSVVIPM